jgi:uncharacterized protein involved in exopolysaccharide biosynthesis
MDNRTNLPLTGLDDGQGASRELRRMLTIVKRAFFNWQWSAVIVAVGLAAGVGVAVIKKPSYRSETIVIYRQGVKMNEEGAAQSLSLGVRLQEMLQARARLEGLLDELGLYQDVKQKDGEVEAVEAFRADITFKARSTDTFSISYKGRDPALVQKVTERLAQSLIEENQRLRVEQAKTQREFLEAQKSQSEVALKDKERDLARFLAEHPEFALDQNAQAQQGASIRAAAQANKAGSKDSALDALERQAARSRAALEGGTPPPAPGAPATDPALEAALSQAQSELASAKAELADKKAKYTDQHPDVIAANGKVSEAQAHVKAAQDKIRDSKAAAGGNDTSFYDPDTAKDKLRDQVKRLDAEIAERRKAMDDKAKGKAAPEAVNDEANRVVALETEWARLSRDLSESRDRMNELERNYFRAQIEASSSLGGYSDQVVVLDPAYLPSRPNPPGKTLIVILAFGASFVLAMIISLMRALLDNRIYEESDLVRVAPVLAVVPRSGARRWWRRDKA